MRDFLMGVRLFGRGLGILLRTPRLLLLGALPAVLTALLLLGGMVALVYWIDDLAVLVTPFADDWVDASRAAARFIVGVLLFIAALAVGLLSFSALTLAVGAPFYELIAEKVDEDLGHAPGTQLPWYRLLGMSLRDGLLLVLRSLVFTIPLLLAGLLPVVGQTVVPVLLVLVTGWFLALELVAVSFYRQGIGLKERRRLLSGRRALALGLGVPAALLCAIPLAAIIVMPVAFVGGVLVAEETLRPHREP